LLALVGLVTIAVQRRRLPRAWPLIAGSILLVSLLKLGYLLEARRRLPLTYLLIVVAALGVQSLSGALRGRAASARSGRGPRATPASARRSK
jgi:hydrogenase/urease accessory protein HupE